MVVSSGKELLLIFTIPHGLLSQSPELGMKPRRIEAVSR
jgi:hypothetical protein